MKYKPQAGGRPKKHKRRRSKKYPGPSSRLRKTQYKVLNITSLTHRMLKELGGYYKLPMRQIVHQIIEAAFKRALAEIEQEERTAEQYRRERERAAQNTNKY